MSQRTADQWLEMCDWYQSGVENGIATGYAAGFEDAYQLAAQQFERLLDEHYETCSSCDTCHEEFLSNTRSRFSRAS